MKIGLHQQELRPPVIEIEIIVNRNAMIILRFISTIIFFGIYFINNAKFSFDHNCPFP